MKCGDRIPSVRELALTNKVNPNTMQRALTELEELGLVYTERTNGKFVTTDYQLIDRHRKQSAQELTKKYLNAMESIGVSKEQVMENLNKFGGNSK